MAYRPDRRIAMGKHKTYDAAFKVEVVLEALRGEQTMAEICRKREIAQDLLCRWRQDFLARAPQLFTRPQQQSAEQARIAELERLVGQLTLELSASKKAWERLPSRSCSNGRS
jgi:transposase